MNTEKKTYNNKIELSLSALMFFSPLIQNLIKKSNTISELDKNFIKWFIKLWYFNIILLIISIITQISFYITKIPLLQTTSFITIIIVWVSLTIWSIYAILNKEIFKNNHEIKIDKTHLLEEILYYIPIYNIYLWYKKHEFEKSNLILKESILLRTIFTALLIISSGSNLIFIILIFIIIRIVSIINWIYWWEKSLKKINNIFKKNPEEMFAYIIWIWKTIFNWKTIKENILMTKQKYELIPKIDYKQILLQYIILSLLICLLIYKWYINNNLNLMIWSLLIIWRYWIMIVKRQHVPNLPIIKEFVDLFFKNKI